MITASSHVLISKGTTWMQELVWMVVNQCDFSTGQKPLNIRSPFLEQVITLFRYETSPYRYSYTTGPYQFLSIQNELHAAKGVDGSIRT